MQGENAVRKDEVPAFPRDTEIVVGRKKEPSILRDFLMLLMKIGFIAGFTAILFTFVFGITQAADNSMAPAVRAGDIILYYRLDKSYIKDDAIVVNENGGMQVRRVEAVAGDTVDFDENGFLVNTNLQVEEDIYTETLPVTGGPTYPVTLSDDQVFVLGDNREAAVDSRVYGPVSISGTCGKVMTVIRRRGI
ncbi:MAG: signal peptidase I [Lachnospiraceae bacterium]|nr:signal peptidase I [Lachnospiraceae bacterium]